MSTFEPKHDRALLGAPWLSSSGWLFKYAPHPDRAGYVFIATDLAIVLFESLTAPSIPSRLQSLTSSQSQQRGSASQRTEGDIIKQAERVLQQLEHEVMRPGQTWASADVAVQEHAFYDRVVEVTTGHFHWVFNMTELKSPQPLVFITKHLLGPLAASHPDTAEMHRNVSPVLLISNLLAKPDFAQSLTASTPGPSGPSNRPRAGRTATARSESQSVVPESIPEESEAEEEDEQEGVYEDEQHVDLKTHAAGTDNEREDNSSPSGNDSGQVDNETDIGADADLPAARTRSHGAVAQPTSPKTSKRRRTDTSSAPARASSPAKPVSTPTPTQSSQRSKKEREREEEELMEKRREEIKRKMGAGHGGRLNRRRAAR